MVYRWAIDLTGDIWFGDFDEIQKTVIQGNWFCTPTQVQGKGPKKLNVTITSFLLLCDVWLTFWGNNRHVIIILCVCWKNVQGMETKGLYHWQFYSYFKVDRNFILLLFNFCLCDHYKFLHMLRQYVLIWFVDWSFLWHVRELDEQIPVK